MSDNYWAQEIDVASVKKSDSSKFKITLCKNEKGKVYVSIREWYKSRSMKEYAPGRNGMTSPIELATGIIEGISTAVRNLPEIQHICEVCPSDKEDCGYTPEDPRNCEGHHKATQGFEGIELHD